MAAQQEGHMVVLGRILEFENDTNAWVKNRAARFFKVGLCIKGELISPDLRLGPGR